MSRDLKDCDWRRIYDLIIQLWPYYEKAGLQEAYRARVNRLLAGYGIAWDLTATGELSRVLPVPVQEQITQLFDELSSEQFRPALVLARSGQSAYNDQPRRSRDACANMFDAMESVAKIRFNLPDATFGQVVAHVKQKGGLLQPEIITLLENVNLVRNKHFGHGMNAVFALSDPEVDMTYLSCAAGMLLFTRLTLTS